MINERFKISDTDGTVPDTSDLKMELRGDKAQTFHRMWDESKIVMQKQSDERAVEEFVPQTAREFDQLKQLVAVQIQDTVRTSEFKSCTKLKRMVTRHLEQKA